MVESPREVCICNKSNPLQHRGESEVHKRTHGASTIASFLTVIQNFLRSENQEIKRGKRLSYVNEPPNARCQSSSEAPHIAGLNCKISENF